jgi:hypothetical protein
MPQSGMAIGVYIRGAYRGSDTPPRWSRRVPEPSDDDLLGFHPWRSCWLLVGKTWSALDRDRLIDGVH